MQTFKDVWKEVRSYCESNVSNVAYNTWILPIVPVEFKNGAAVLSVQHSLQREVIEQTYAPVIIDGFEAVMGFRAGLKIICDENEELTVESLTVGAEYTFDNYVVGPSNRFAHAASLAVAENPHIVYNPLFIYGNSGVGKTHLMRAIANKIEEKYPQKRLLYMRTEEFTNDLIKCLNEGKMDDFHNRFRSVDVLLLDDIQFIAGKDTTQEEFFNTFNALQQNNKQIVVTSDRPPKDIKSLEDRIRSRFDSGLLADIQPPEFETRVGIIQRKAKSLGLDLDDKVVYYIADQVKQNIRQLEGVVKKLQAIVTLDGTHITEGVAQGVIRNIRNDSQPEPITVARVVSEVARTYSVSAEDIMSKKQNAAISKCRQIVMYILREVTDMKYKEIGEQFGKNHTTAMYSISRAEDMMKKQPREKETIEDIIKNLQSDR